MNRQKLGFTLLELIVVIVIIAILAVISLPQFTTMKESSLDQEAIANLKLIQAAEKIYKMETAFYYPPNLTNSDIGVINRWLKLSIPTADTRNWNYQVNNTTGVFIGKAQRVTNTAKVKCIQEANDEPYTAGCTW